MDNKALYEERLERVRKVINFEPVDRLPIIQNASAFGPRYVGKTIADFCRTDEAPLEITLAAMDKLGGLDGINLMMGGRMPVVLPSAWLSRVGWPGRDLPDDSLWQVREAEIMTVEDYDTIINKGWGAFLQEYMPKVVDMAEFAQTMGWLMANARRVADAYREKGYVPVAASAIAIPFDYLCGGRSMAKFFLDLYLIPDKVEAALDVILPEVIGQAIGTTKAAGTPAVWVGGWRCAGAMVAPRLWQRFVWPYLVKIVEALVAQGITPILHLDQDWTRDLGYFRDLPARKCAFNPDGMTNVRKFHEILGDHITWMGDTSATLFAAGTPDDIRNYVRFLVELFEGKGLILAPGCDAPINTKPENMEAFVAAAREFGKVS